MKKIVNGVVMEMTPEEIRQIEDFLLQMPEVTPTAEERLAELEQKVEQLLKEQ